VKIGVLKKGFIIHNDVWTIKIPKDVVVVAGFDRDARRPTVWFKGFDIRIFRYRNEYYADVYGCIMLLKFLRIPYPITLIA